MRVVCIVWGGVCMLLGVVEQVEAQGVGGGQDVVQQVNSSPQVSGLDQTPQQTHSL